MEYSDTPYGFFRRTVDFRDTQRALDRWRGREYPGFGPMVAGLVCGPYIGIGSGIIGGLFRFSQGGQYMWTGLSAPILSGILGGIMYLANKRQVVPTWVAVLLIWAF